MKIHLNISIVVILFLSFRSYAQDLKRKELISKFQADKESLFVINGIAFSYSDSLALEAKLSKIENNKISEITILKHKGEISPERNDLVIIEYATKLPQHVIEKKLNEIKPKFKDEYIGFSQHIFVDAADPVLYFNGNKIHHAEIKDLIKRLMVNDIGYIYFSQTPQSEEYHGQNAKNGFVVIWTKDRLIDTK